MRYIHFIILTIMFSFSHCFSQVDFKDLTIEQVSNSNQVKLSQKKILVYFTTSWCSACKVLEKQVFQDIDKSTYINNHYICLKIDGDSKMSMEIMRDYNIIDMYPTTLILDNQGREVDRIIGYGDKDEYFDELVDYFNDNNTLQDFLNRIKNEPNNGELYFNLALKYESRGNIKEQLFYMQKAINFEPYKNNHHYWYLLCVLYEKNKDVDKAVESLSKAIELSPGNSHYSAYLQNLISKR